MLNLVSKVGPDYKEPQGLTALGLYSTAAASLMMIKQFLKHVRKKEIQYLGHGVIY